MSVRPLVERLTAIGAEVVGRDLVDSTNTLAMTLAADGAPHGSIVVADGQTAGRGRIGRTWYSPPGRHLYYSIIWRPPWPASRAPQVTLQVAVAVAEAIQTVMRRYGIDEPYEKLKSLTRGKRIDAAGLAEFVDGLALPDEVRAELKAMRPETYIGNAAEQARRG